MSKPKQIILNTILLVVVFLSFFLAQDPRLYFHIQQLGFTTDEFIRNEFLSYPRGITEYITLFLFQFCNYKFWGSLLFALLFLGIVHSLRNVLKSKNNESSILLVFVPVILMGINVVNLLYPLIFMVNLLLMLNLILVGKRMLNFKFNPVLSAVIVMLFLFPVYYLLGGSYFLAFIASCLMVTLFQSKRNKGAISIALILAGLLWPLVSAKYFFFITLEDAFFRIYPYVSDYELSGVDYFVVLSVPLVVLLHGLLDKFVSNRKTNPIITGIQYLFLIAILGVVLNVFDNQEEKDVVQVDYWATERAWDKIIDYSEGAPSDNRLINFNTNCALYQKGELLNRMFEFNQKWGVDGLFLTKYLVGESLIPTTRLYLEMGYINEAIHWANEAVSFHENSPLIIEQLIKAHLIAGNYKAADLYVEVLKKFPFQKKIAKAYEEMVTSKSLPQELLEKRNLMPFVDFKAELVPSVMNLQRLLADHPENKMVYEYLMAYYLLDGNIAYFIHDYQLGKRFNYTSLPKHFQEAIMLYILNRQENGLSYPKIKLDQQLVNNFQEYFQVIENLDGDMDVARLILEERFGDTYWYYFQFQRNLNEDN